MDKNIPLSTLIEIGCRKTIPAKGSYLTMIDLQTLSGDTVLEACALGAAAVAKTGQLTDNIDVGQAIGHLLQVEVKHPAENIKENVKCVVVSLNDEHEWPREHIAYWLKTIGL